MESGYSRLDLTCELKVAGGRHSPYQHFTVAVTEAVDVGMGVADDGLCLIRIGYVIVQFLNQVRIVGLDFDIVIVRD